MTETDDTPNKYYANVVAIKDLAGYQEDSIVSRTIINRKSGTVTFFAFDQGQALSEHTAPCDALVHVLDGLVEVTVLGKPMRLKEGDMVLLPANEPHALKAINSFKMVLVMINA